MGLQGVQGVNNNSSANILFKYQHVLRSFMRDLDMEHAQFRSTIEKILGGLVDEVELASLLENRNAALWKDKELERRLKQRIGPEAYRTYMATVERVASALAELWETVGLKQTKVSNVGSLTRITMITEPCRKTNGTKKCVNASRGV